MRVLQILAIGFAALLIMVAAMAQSPTPAVSSSPAITASPAILPTPIPTATPEPLPDFTDTIKVLEQMKAANEETLKKQRATLELLDDLQKEADQLRIFAKRG